YRVSRSAMSRCLKPTRPNSMRHSLASEARMAAAAVSPLMSRDSRRRRRRGARMIRCTGGPPRRGAPEAAPGGQGVRGTAAVVALAPDRPCQLGGRDPVAHVLHLNLFEM